MTAYSDAIVARYAARESETDTFGRAVEVRRLRPADSFWVRQIAASDLNDVATEALIASSVCSITDAAGKTLGLNPPRNAQELSARLDLLEAEGMSAAMTAYARLMVSSVPKVETPAKPDLDAADSQGKRGRRDRQPAGQTAE